MLVLTGCGAIPHAGKPAKDYVYASGAVLRVAVLDQTGGTDWAPAIHTGTRAFDDASPFLLIQDTTDAAHIVVVVRRYRDEEPPALQGYRFQPGVGGFAAVYDADGTACNFPPSPLPVNCSGEIARVDIYLNDIIPPGPDIDERRLRLVLHELGHALGLTRHSPDIDTTQLARRYGWPQ